MGADLLNVVGLAYCVLFMVLSVRKVRDPEWSAYARALPLVLKTPYTVSENRLSRSDEIKVALTSTSSSSAAWRSG